MWKKLEQTDKEALNREISLQHHAIQFIARTGKYLIPEKDDDSHTNMEWKTPISSFIGNYLPHFMLVGIKIPEVKLTIYDENYYVYHAIEMSGLTGKEVFEWLRKALQARKIETQNLKYELHYEIPDHNKYDEQPFPELPQPGKGKWIINGWKGSVLPFSTITNHNEAREQKKTVKTFFRESVNITRDLLE
ncbi:MAG: hypothetical protein K9J27_11355 [Bacteroidales bacterium]|nr:hypothetical protein [Bacteroidales bacterium]MCF8334547.1 hypothetical protein [Bacteroidales bacterium]